MGGGDAQQGAREANAALQAVDVNPDQMIQENIAVNRYNQSNPFGGTRWSQDEQGRWQQEQYLSPEMQQGFTNLMSMLNGQQSQFGSGAQGLMAAQGAHQAGQKGSYRPMTYQGPSAQDSAREWREILGEAPKYNPRQDAELIDALFGGRLTQGTNFNGIYGG